VIQVKAIKGAKNTEKISLNWEIWLKQVEGIIKTDGGARLKAKSHFPTFSASQMGKSARLVCCSRFKTLKSRLNI